MPGMNWDNIFVMMPSLIYCLPKKWDESDHKAQFMLKRMDI